MSSDALQAVAAQIKGATSFMAVFGALPAGDQKIKKQALKKSFHFLARTVHPDNVPGHEALATDTFKMLNDLHRKAEEALESGSYESSFAALAAATFDGVLLQSASDTYQLSATSYREGDFSVLYRGSALSKKVPVLVKISSEPIFNSWLEREAILLTRFRDAKSGSSVAAIGRFVPKLIDTFLIEGPGRTRYRVNVTNFMKDVVSVAQIIEAYPRGLEPVQVAWVARRVIAQALAAQVAGVVHGAITPDHVLVGPVTHEPVHIGWVHAIEAPKKNSGRITHVIDRWRDFYPPEVFDKKAPDLRTDLYMAGKTVIKLLGGDVKRNTLPTVVPDEMKKITLRLVEESPSCRPSDGAAYLDEFTRVVRGIWGRKYRPLDMPVQ
jgi:hypothetical protein